MTSSDWSFQMWTDSIKPKVQVNPMKLSQEIKHIKMNSYIHIYSYIYNSYIYIIVIYIYIYIKPNTKRTTQYQKKSE
jgi:hypothetical protein